MPDLSTTGATEELRLTNRVGWEVVMKEERFPVLLDQAVDLLLVLTRAEGCGDDALGLASGKQRRPVDAREEGYLDRDRPDGLVVTTIDAALLVEHLPAHRVVAKVLVGTLDIAFEIRELRRQLGHDFLFDFAKAAVARVLLRDVAGLDDPRESDLFDPRVDLLVSRVRREGPLFLADRLADLLDELEDTLHRLVTELDGGDQVRFGQLIGFAFDHDDGVLGRGHDQLAVAVLLFLVRRVRDQLAFDARDTDTSDGSCPGNRADVNGRRGAHHCEHVGLIAPVCADHGCDDLCLAHVAVGKEGAAGPVDQSAGEDLMIALPRLALEEAPRDLAGSVGLFDVVAGQRKKRRAGPRLFVSNDSDEDHGLATAHQHRAGCLFGNTARLDGDLFVTNFNGFSNYHCSLCLPFRAAQPRMRFASTSRAVSVPDSRI